jgi:uncharacterized protein YcfL
MKSKRIVTRWPALVAAVALAAAGLGGCASSTAPPNVTILDNLAPSLVFGAAVVDEGDADRPMRITMPVRQTASFDLHVQYQFQFLDDQGRPLRSNLGWRYLMMAPQIEYFMEGAALETTATSWRLNIKSSQ